MHLGWMKKRRLSSPERMSERSTSWPEVTAWRTYSGSRALMPRSLSSVRNWTAEGSPAASGQGRGHVSPLLGVGTAGREPLHHVGPPRALPALILVEAAPGRPRRGPLVSRRLRRPLAPVHFLRVARVKMARTGVNVPLWVSDRETLEQAGPMGQAWRNPDIWYPTYAFA